MAETGKPKTIYWIIGIVVVVVFSFLLVPPLFALINRVEPWVVGLPFFAFMELVSGLIIAAMLVLLYSVQKRRGEL
jgi:hypothetical protein